MENSSCPLADGICDGWSARLDSFATPLEKENFDKNYSNDIDDILNICRDSDRGIDPVSTLEVKTDLKNSNQTRNCVYETLSPNHMLVHKDDLTR